MHSTALLAAPCSSLQDSEEYDEVEVDEEPYEAEPELPPAMPKQPPPEPLSLAPAEPPAETPAEPPAETPAPAAEEKALLAALALGSEPEAREGGAGSHGFAERTHAEHAGERREKHSRKRSRSRKRSSESSNPSLVWCRFDRLRKEPQSTKTKGARGGAYN